MRMLWLHLLIAIVVIGATASTEPPPPPPAPPPPAPAPPPPPPPVEEVADLGSWEAAPARVAWPRDGRFPIRERPSDSARVVAVVTGDELSIDALEVLGASGAFLRIAGRRTSEAGIERVEGWAAWGDVIPEYYALAVDTHTGATTGRLALEGGMSKVVFLPDGSRALVFGIASCGDPVEGTRTIYEIRTSDLAIARTIEAPGGRAGTVIGSAFYGRDGSVSVLIIEPESQESGALELATVDDLGAIVNPIIVAKRVFAVVASEDGRLALALCERESYEETTFAVVDLATREIRNSFTLDGEIGCWGTSDLALSRDGGELYGIFDNVVVAVSTATGAVVRTTPLLMKETTTAWLGSSRVVGDALLVSAYDEDSGPTAGWWVRGRSAVRSPEAVSLACDAASARFGIDLEGSRLLRLDDRGRVASSVAIDRPELRRSYVVDEGLVSVGVAAYPDASRVLLLAGFESG